MHNNTRPCTEWHSEQEHGTWAIAGFVAQGPDDDGGEVFVPLQHAHASVYDGMHPDGVLSGDDSIVVQGWIKAMRLHVGFVHEVQPILAAELIPVNRQKKVR